MEQNCLCVVGSEAKVAENKELFNIRLRERALRDGHHILPKPVFRPVYPRRIVKNNLSALLCAC